MPDLRRWSNLVSIVGGVTLVVGSVDPMEGSLLILPGSALLALGTYLAHGDRRVTLYRVAAFAMIAVGVGALFWLSARGGIGGPSGRSAWWGLLILPYLIGWSIDLWGPGTPRWLSLAGIVIGAWYLGIVAIVLRRSAGSRPPTISPAIGIGLIGLATIAACAWRLRHRALSSES